MTSRTAETCEWQFPPDAALFRDRRSFWLTPLWSLLEFVEKLLLLQFLHQAQIHEVLRLGLGLLELV